MRIAVLSVLAACFGSLVAPGPAAAEIAEAFRHERVERLGVHLFDQLETKPKPCPSHMYAGQDASFVYCARSPELKKEPRSEVLSRIDEIVSPYARAEGAWESDGHRHRRAYRLEDVEFVVQVNTRKAIVGFGYPIRIARCERSLLETGFLEIMGVEPASIVHKVLPVYPSGALRFTPENVVLQATILADGSVGDACVSYASAPGEGFESAALWAILQWRFRPARRDGTPVESVFTIFVEFRTR